MLLGKLDKAIVAKLFLQVLIDQTSVRIYSALNCTKICSSRFAARLYMCRKSRYTNRDACRYGFFAGLLVLFVLFGVLPASAEIIKDRVRIARSLVNLTLFIDHRFGIGKVRLARKKGWPKSVKIVLKDFPSLEHFELQNGHETIQLEKPELVKDCFSYQVPSKFVTGSDDYIEVSWIDAYR